MKKLVIDANSIVPYFISKKVTGIGRTTLELIQALSRIDNIPFEISLYTQNLKGINAKKAGTRFPCKHLYLRNNEQWNKAISHLPLREWITRYDIMHIPHNFEYVRHPEKCIVTLHDALFMKIQETAFGHEKMKQIIPPFIKECKHIITCSEASKQDIISTMNVSPDKISVIYWGVKHDTFFPIRNRQDVTLQLNNKFNINHPYFFSVSCNAERKQTDILVRSFIQFCKTTESKHDLILVWKNPPSKLLKEIEISGFRKRIHFLKNISDSDLALLYNGATASFTPSSYEGFGLPLLEAMACGTPVVTCNNSSLGEIGADAVIYLDEPIEKSIAETMTLFEKKKVDILSLREKGIRRASDFTWEKTAQQTISIYQQILNP